MAEPLAPRPRPALRVIAGGATGTPPSYTDGELFEGIAAGDERIGAALYRRLMPTLEHGLDTVLGRREARSLALIQASFERIVFTLAERRYAEVCSLDTWATALTVQVALPALRARSRRRVTARLELGERSAPERGPRGSELERKLVTRRDIEFLRVCLAELPAARAEAVVLADLMRLPIGDIAAVLHISRAALQTRLARGRKQLRARLAQSGRGGIAFAGQRVLEQLFLAWQAEVAAGGRSLAVGIGSRQLLLSLRRVARRRAQRRRLRAFGIACAAAVGVFGATVGVWLGARPTSGGDAEERALEPRVLLGSMFGDVSISDGDGRISHGSWSNRALSSSAPQNAGGALGDGSQDSQGNAFLGDGLLGDGSRPAGTLGSVMTGDGASTAGGPSSDGVSLGEGYALRTGEGNAQLTFPSGSSLRLSRHGRVSILQARENEVVFLALGAALVDVPLNVASEGFSVETPDARLSVRNARFNVSVDPLAPETSTHIEVKAGSVSVQHAGQHFEISAGESWPAAPRPRSSTPAVPARG
ncbi:MAG TPA: sigma factor-like helix-turn-helix DNA-binding protein [Polyangiaceae bacterium]|nr:sigma factor-like helix-turn-helix DNA-binding protein [Polyangiaceae bacterium]